LVAHGGNSSPETKSFAHDAKGYLVVLM
jgi:hypothetical protein